MNCKIKYFFEYNKSISNSNLEYCKRRLIKQLSKCYLVGFLAMNFLTTFGDFAGSSSEILIFSTFPL